MIGVHAYCTSLVRFHESLKKAHEPMSMSGLSGLSFHCCCLVPVDIPVFDPPAKKSYHLAP